MVELPNNKVPSDNIGRNLFLSSLLSKPDDTVWELIFDSLPDMVALIDLDNRIVKANKTMLQRSKIGDKSIIGEACSNLMHNYNCTPGNCPHLSMIDDGKPHSIERYEPKFGCYLHISVTPIFDSENNLLGSLHISRDISIQKDAEAKLKKYNIELKELNESKDKFFSMMAHDLRSPFQGLLGFTQLILDELDTLSTDEIKEYLQKVRDSSNSTFTLLENLLNWSRLQTGRLQYNPIEFSINQEVTSIIELLCSNALSKNIKVINAINSDYFVHGDQQMVRSILLNLTSNAIKFTSNGGSVTFHAKSKSMCEHNFNGKPSCNRNCLEISVSDSGIGISKEVQKKLFKTHSQYTQPGTSNEQGAGLGLMLVKEMVEKHGGKLEISSEMGVGSVFSFSVPLAEI